MFKIIKRNIWLVSILSLAFTGITALASEKAIAQKTLTISTIPYPLEAGTQPGDASIKNNTLTLTSFKGSDLFTETDGGSPTDTAPRVLFQPKGDFIFSAKINADFNGTYDGGSLIVYSDTANWAKFLFEYSKFGKFIVSSTVAKPAGDDAYHTVEKTKSVYLKIARAKDMFVFYTSEDGNTWNYVRNFGLKTASPIKIGFSSQSPVGDKFTATFSDIKYKEATFKDFWQGE